MLETLKDETKTRGLGSDERPGETDIFVASLSIPDQTEYFNLQKTFLTSEDRNKRFLGLATFKSDLECVYQFVRKGDSLDIFRGFVCGIIFGSNFILVNTKRLKTIMNRSKSCVNGCLQRLGYVINRQQQDIPGFFSVILPGVNSIFCNSRQWCVRSSTTKTQCYFSPIVPVEISSSFGMSPQKNVQHKIVHYQSQNPPVQTVQQESIKPDPYLDNPLALLDINVLLNKHYPSDCVQV